MKSKITNKLSATERLIIKMKKLVIPILLLVVGNVVGQTIAPAGTYTQNFDGIGATQTASLPTGWKAEAIATERTVTTAYTSVAGTATTQILANGAALSGTAANGIYNFGNGSTSTDRTVGGLSSASASKSVNMFVKLTNSSATTSIPSFTVTYDAKRFRNGSNTAGFSIRLYYSTTGNASSWTEITAGALSFAANANNNGSTTNPSETKTATNIALAQSLAASGTIYFAWSYSVTSGSTTSNAQALGIDNITIAAVSSVAITPATSSLALTSIAYGKVLTTGSTPVVQSQTISASGLGGTAITATAPNTNIQVSSDGTTFGNTATVASTGGTLYYRLSPTANVGSYSGSITLESGATSSSITITSSSVTAAALTVTASAQSKAYGTTAPTSGTLGTNFFVTGLQNSDAVNGVTLGYSGSPAGNLATATVAGSPYTITPSSVNFSSGLSSNYSISYSTGALTLSSVPLTITGLTGANKEYDATTAATFTGTAAYSGLVNGDNPSIAGTPAGSFATATVGTSKAITVTGYTAPNSNYSVSQPTGLTGNITSKSLTITGVTAASKLFDGNTTATLTGTPALSGVIAADTANVSIDASGVSATFGDAAVGTAKSVTVTGYSITGSASTNYSLSQPTGLTADITSSPSPVISSSLIASGTYYSAFSAYQITASNSPSSFNASGLPAGLGIDTDTGIISGTPTVTGSFNVTISATNAGGTGSATLAINIGAKQVTLTAGTAVSKEYNGNTTATVTGASISGVVLGDTVNVTATGTFDTKTVGTAKSVAIAYALNGADAAKYVLDTNSSSSSADITAKPLTVTGATVTSKSYTGTDVATITGASVAANVVSPDAVGVTGGGTFAQVNVGTGISVTTSFTLTGADAGNYSITQPTSLTGTITTAPLTINIAGLTANKVYDATTTAFITGAASYNGLQNGETFSVTGTPTGSFATKGIGTAKAITVAGYTAPNANYTVTQPTTLTGNITVATLTVTGAVAANKVFNGTTATTTSGGTFVGVLLSDVVTLTHGVANFASSAVGTGIAVTSAITATGTDGANYTVTQPTLTANITAAPVTLATWNFGTASPGSAVAGSVPTNLSVSTISQGNSFGATTLLSTTSGSTGYAGVSGSYNGAVAANVGSLNTATTTNAYFEFTVTPSNTYYFSISSISFGSRSTGTGPTNYSLRSSADAYGSDIATGTLSANSAWALKTNASLNSISPDSTPLTYRIYGYGGTGNPSSGSVNWRIDDLNVTGFVLLSKTPPTLSADATANTVDNNNEITFDNDSDWTGSITAVKIGSTVLTPTTDYVVAAGVITLKPSGGNSLLITAGSKAITVIATGYANATVTQAINAGVPTSNSTATINTILAPSATRTITCTALDQYSNLVSGYTFKYTATITNANATTGETYTIDGADYTATTTQNVSGTVISTGVTTFTAALPSTLDTADGISIQVKLADGTTNISTPFAYYQLPGQTITFNSLSNVTYGDAQYTISATGGDSGNPVVFTSSDSSVATCSGTNGTTITVVGPGTCTIYANQAGNSNYNAAEQVGQTLTVDKKALTIADAAAQPKVYNGTDTATITGTLSGVISPDVVTLTLSGTFADVNANIGIAVTSTSTLGGANAGKYTLTQPTGLTSYITQVTTNTINGFGAITNKIIGQASFTLAATSSTGLTVTYTSSDENVATISGNTVTIVGVGVTNITAAQAGNGNYVAATPIVQELKVTPVPIAAWDFTGVGSTTIASLAATTFDANLVTTSGASTITRGATAGWSTAGNSFRTQGFQNNGIATSNTDYFQVTLTPASGQNVSLSTINANFNGTAGFYATPGVTSQYAYSLNGTTFTLIGSPVTSTSLKPAEIDLSGITALQGVTSGTTITIRYYASGQTTTGGWGFFSAAAGTNGLSIGGSIAATQTTTWDGSSWSNGTPTISKNAVIEGAYSTTNHGEFSANTLTVSTGNTFTINSGYNITVGNALTNNGTFIVENNANLIQNGVTNNNSGDITAKRINSSMKRLDYTYWSSPTAKSDYSLKMFSPMTMSLTSTPTGGASRFYTLSESGNAFEAVDPVATYFDTSNIAKGFSIRAPNNFPTNGTTATFNANFVGVPNNGTITIPVTYSGAGKGNNLIGNPYPSAIDASAFLNYSPDGTAKPNAGTMYFWTHTTQAAGSANYASYNLSGGTASTLGGSAPNGTVQVGQGFILKKSAASTAVFTNSMRLGNNQGQFFRTATTEKNRIWLNLTNETTPINQMMIGYIEGTTLGFDDSYDGKLLNSGSSISSKISDENYVIQARPTPFENTDAVALNFKADTAGSYTLAIDHVDGLFLGEQNVYLRDNLLNVTHDIKASAYTFTSEQGTFGDRFDVVYNNSTLNISTPTFDANSVIVYKNDNKVLNINAGKVVMKNVKIYDARGRMIYEQSNINSTTAVLNDLKAEKGVLLVKVTSEDNKVVTKKVVY